MRNAALLALIASGMILIESAALAQVIHLDKPGDKDFILDRAGLLKPEDAAKIKEICTKLLYDEAIPVVVVTIESMAEYGGRDMRIETFATLLFDQWGIGYEKVNDKPFNRGMLLLVSAGDRKARIELGADWSHDFDKTCDKIMQEQIISRFKQGDYSGGIAAGVQSLDSMARGLKLPAPPIDWKQVAIGLGIVALLVFTVVSLIRSGASGWGWLLWAAVFGILGYILYNALTSRGGAGGGGFSGGSFGGGFSGGGGATGSW